MNFLALVQRLKQECGVSGAMPTTVLNQPTEINRLVGWLSSAWMDLQTSHDDWFFLRQPFVFNTVAQQQSYTPVQCGVSLLGNWKQDSFRLYSPALGYSNEMILPYLPYDTFRDMYMYGNMRSTYARPVTFSIDPQKNIVLGTSPDQTYTVNGEYYLQPTELATDTDTPSMPAQFHMILVYRAMMFYGGFEAASEVYQRGEAEYTRLLRRLELDQLPTITFAAPLA